MGNERFIFGFWESPTTGWHTCKVKKCLHLSYNMHVFCLPYLLNDSQTNRLTIHFFKPLLCMMLICSDWSYWSHFHFIMPVIILQCLWAQCCFVYSYTGETAILPLQKWRLVAKNELAFSFRPTRKRPQVGRKYIRVDVNMKRLGICFKKLTRFNDSELTLLLRDNDFIQGALSDLNFAGCFHSLRALSVAHSIKGN